MFSCRYDRAMQYDRIEIFVCINNNSVIHFNSCHRTMEIRNRDLRKPNLTFFEIRFIENADCVGTIKMPLNTGSSTSIFFFAPNVSTKLCTCVILNSQFDFHHSTVHSLHGNANNCNTIAFLSCNRTNFFGVFSSLFFSCSFKIVVR